MRYLRLLSVLLATLAWAQEKVPTNVPPEYQPPITRENDEPPGMPPSAASVGPDAAVITIHGICDHPADRPTASSNAGAAGETCQTVITRAEFERLTDALLANMKLSMRKQLANSYPNLLALAREAEARHLDQSTHFEERMAFARLQILSQEMVRQVDQESANVPEKDIADYYRDHASSFEQATLERVYIPNRKRTNPLPQDKATPEAVQPQRKAAEDAMIRAADDLHRRALAGESFANLQKQAFAAANLTDVPPNWSLGTLNAISVPPGHVSIFTLKAGEISNVISDSTGHYFYKVDARTTQSLDDVRDEIHKILQRQHREAALQAIEKPVTTEMNPAYFGPEESANGAPGSKSK